MVVFIAGGGSFAVVVLGLARLLIVTCGYTG